VEGLGINGTFLLSQIVNFLILFVALYFLLWKRVLNALDARRQRIQEGLETAERAKEELARAQATYAEKVAAGKAEAERIKAEAGKAAEQERAQVLAQAQARAKKERTELRAQVDLEREQMLRDLRGQIGALAIAAAQKIIAETLDEQRQVALVQSFFSGIEAGKVAILSQTHTKLAGQAAVVTSALPLDKAERGSYQAALAGRLGADAQITFRTNPAILGGVIIRVGDQVVDDSIAGKLEALEGQLAAG